MTNLTPAQQRAAHTLEKNILVSAGAGTGKTCVLVERFLHLVLSNEALVNEILTVTFTEKAAAEMKVRILNHFNKLEMRSARRDLESAYISTIHAFCARVLKEHPLEAGINPAFGVMEEDAAMLMKERALDEALSQGCDDVGAGFPPKVDPPPAEKPAPTFELLLTYGEDKLRDGILKIFHTARNEGKSLSDYFGATPPPTRWGTHLVGGGGNLIQEEIEGIFKDLGQRELASDWNSFSRNPEWDWNLIAGVREWSAPFSRRGGKNDKEKWKRAVALIQAIIAMQLDRLALPWKQKFEAIALRFEKNYSDFKKAESVLDFDDLQLLTFALFTDQDPVKQQITERYRNHFKHILVDESQDTNPLQMQILEALSRGRNLFWVGDFKQSIYGFRGAFPQQFLEKEKQYANHSEAVRICLLENFRAEEPILNFINGFFADLWKGVGATGPVAPTFEPLKSNLQSSGKQFPVEILAVRPEEEESLDLARFREAGMIAHRIEELHQEGTAYGDIAILFQALGAASGIYEEQLKKEGIPYVVFRGRGFYKQPEIRDLISFLEALERPALDIPLAAVLRSPFFQVTDDTLFWLAQHAKSENSKIPLYASLHLLESFEEISEPEKQKLLFFRNIFTGLYHRKDKLQISVLIRKILKETSYEFLLLGSSEGLRKWANVKKLIEIARREESRRYLSIGDFLGLLAGIEESEMRESEASLEAESGGAVVRLMTIHSAKGLEYPVVFLSDLGREKQDRDSKTFIAEPGQGYGMKIANPFTEEEEKPLEWRRITEIQKEKQLEEWKRLLYVAMTRAKNRLIFSGVYKESASLSFPHDFKRESMDPRLKTCGDDNGSTWMAWVIAYAEGLEGKIPIRYGEALKAEAHRKKPLRPPLISKYFKDFKPCSVEDFRLSENKSQALIQQAQEILQNIRPVEIPPVRAMDLPVSAYVLFSRSPEAFWNIYELGGRDQESEIKPQEERQTFTNDEETGVSAADFGTAFHQVLQWVDYQKATPASFDSYSSYFAKMGGVAQKRAVEMFRRYAESSFFRTLKRAKRLWREFPFFLNERHGFIHGVIDLIFENEKGEWTLVDFKTSKADGVKAEALGYRLQMDIYAYALWRLTRKIPRKATLHFLEDGGPPFRRASPFSGGQILFDYSADKLAQIGGRIQQMQVDILAYVNKKRSNEEISHKSEA